MNAAATPTPATQIMRNGLALLIGVMGYLMANGLNFPAPALTGPALFVSIASVAGARVDIHAWLRNCAFMLIGIAMGSGVTPEVYQAAQQWPGSFLLLATVLVSIFFICRYALQRWWQLDRQTATLSSTPGHLSYVLGLSVNTKGDIAVISVIQSLRVLALTLAVPVVVTLLGYRVPELLPTVHDMHLLQLGAILVVALAIALFFVRIKLAASFLLAGMAISSLTHLSGWATGALPVYLSLPAIVVMGTIIGTRLSGVKWSTLRKAATGGLAVTAIAMTLSGLAAFSFSIVSGLPLGQLLIAFSPGGVEAMIAMALILDADPTFVAAHHVWRLLTLTILAPLMLARRSTSRT